MVSNLAELLGYALIVAFLYILWPPLALLSGGLLLVLWANVRTGKGRTASAIGAAFSAAKASYTEQKTLRRIS
jgi:asparagine N-glycosylation enzyme membrane subunit Stt3